MKKSEHMTRQALLAELFILHLKEEAFRSYIGKIWPTIREQLTWVFVEN